MIFSLAETSGSFEEFSQKVARAYPELDTEALSEQVEKAIFISRAWGTANAGD